MPHVIADLVCGRPSMSGRASGRRGVISPGYEVLRRQSQPENRLGRRCVPGGPPGWLDAVGSDPDLTEEISDDRGTGTVETLWR
jgi:hypothetical protein